jgi:hypothetical protein
VLLIVNLITDSKFDFHPIRDDCTKRDWSIKEKLARMKRARKPRASMGALGFLAGAGDGHYCANAAY